MSDVYLIRKKRNFFNAHMQSRDYYSSIRIKIEFFQQLLV